MVIALAASQITAALPSLPTIRPALLMPRAYAPWGEVDTVLRPEPGV